MSFVEALQAVVDSAGKTPELAKNVQDILKLVKKENTEAIPQLVAISGDIYSEVSSLPKMKESVNQIKQTQEENVCRLLESFEQKIEQQKKEIINSFGNVSEIRSELDGIKQKLVIKNSTIEAQKTDIDKLKKELKEKEDELHGIQQSNGNNEETIKTLMPQAEELKVWKDVAKPYQELKDSMLSCEPAKKFLTEKGLDTVGAESTFKLAVSIGCNHDFAKQFYEFMKKWKKEHTKPISGDEQQVYVGINQCYKIACGMDKELFQLPDGRSVSDKFEKISFDKNSMEDLTDPGTNNLNFAKELYVPSLRSLTSASGGLLGKSQVKAGNS